MPKKSLFLKSYRFKLYLGAFVAFFLMVSLAVIFGVTEKIFYDTTEKIHNQYIEAANQSSKARMIMLDEASRAHEFLLSKHLIEDEAFSLSHSNDFDDGIALFLEKIGTIKVLLHDVSAEQWHDIEYTEQKFSAKIEAIHLEITQYQKSFHLLFEKTKALGFENQGLVGLFREKAHDLEKNFSKEAFNHPELYILLLQMRRNEKDFMLRNKNKYSVLFNENGRLLQQGLDKVGKTGKNVTGLQKTLNIYMSSFAVMSEATLSLEADVEAIKQSEIVLDVSLKELHLLAESIVVASLNDLDEKVLRAYIGILMIIALFIIFGVLFEYGVIRVMMKKGNRLVLGALKFRAGKLDYRIPVDGKDEFTELARLYNGMAKDIGASQRELEQFSYVASHDLQEPLRMVSSYTQLLAKRYAGQLDERADKYINYAVDGATRMQVLINDLLAYSRVNASSKALKAVSTQVLLNHTKDDLSIAIEEASAEVLVEGELPEVLGDGVQLKQAFQNIISNAIKYNESEKPHVIVSAKRVANMWEISFADNGIGIPKEARTRAFQIFQRLHERDKYQGTGLGLAIVKKIVDQHHGMIRIESNQPFGSVFVLSLAKV